MKTYKSFKDIDNDLRRLDLERQIAWEELKLVKEDIKEDLQPINWVRSAIKMAGKMGGFMLLKKIIK
ncbi:DUF6327 family protein [Oceanihabitans sp. 2_MG-2023]|uniref:DUF6327 family protein n=1 Tax=Oceanihabitans sp. 2_MG-2023 TaxID=3062661 RepID=UPI0026E3A0E5|nr:DUF6327 family protein [Oceanihabitans sp. 2_MG-2023]MDO6598144.1 DUF6327 family protein [Oceanihabitans sp. 2_MG-2023]